MKLNFVVNKENLSFDTDDYDGVYIMRELTVQETMTALDDAAKDPEEMAKLTLNEYNKIIIEAATTVNGQPLKIDMAKMPQKLWGLLLAANEKVNGLSDAEARFLLLPCGQKASQSTPP